MKIARFVRLFIITALVVAPVSTAFAIWPFTSSTTNTSTTPKVTSAKPHYISKSALAKKQQPSMMQKMWNGMTSPFSSSSKPTTKTS